MFDEEHAFQREVLDRASRQGLRSRLHVVPFVNDVGRALRALDVVLHTSLKPEPFGRVIVEAMASGIPVVAARAGGVPEILEDGVDGLLVCPGDADDYARAVLKLEGSPEGRSGMVRAATRKVDQRFRVDRVASEWSGLFESSFL